MPIDRNLIIISFNMEFFWYSWTSTEEWTEGLLESPFTKHYSRAAEGNINHLSDKYHVSINYIKVV